jgi:hypothetical protein
MDTMKSWNGRDGGLSERQNNLTQPNLTNEKRHGVEWQGRRPTNAWQSMKIRDHKKKQSLNNTI